MCVCACARWMMQAQQHSICSNCVPGSGVPWAFPGGFTLPQCPQLFLHSPTLRWSHHNRPYVHTGVCQQRSEAARYCNCGFRCARCHLHPCVARCTCLARDTTACPKVTCLNTLYCIVLQAWPAGALLGFVIAFNCAPAALELLTFLCIARFSVFAY